MLTFTACQKALIRLGIESDPTSASASTSMSRYSIVTLGRWPPAPYKRSPRFQGQILVHSYQCADKMLQHAAQLKARYMAAQQQHAGALDLCMVSSLCHLLL